LIGKAHFTTSHTFTPTGTPECRASSANYGADWTGPYMGFSEVELMLEGHNHFPPMEPPRGMHYERWYHADGRGAERTEQYLHQLPPLTDATQTWNSALPSPGTTRHGSATARSIICARIGTRISACGHRSRIHIIPSMHRSRGAACMIPTTSTCLNTAPWIWSGARGGIGLRSKAFRR
jgi:hypothetical protein